MMRRSKRERERRELTYVQRKNDFFSITNCINYQRDKGIWEKKNVRDIIRFWSDLKMSDKEK